VTNGAEPGAFSPLAEVLVRSERALATLAVLAVGLGLVGADAAVADPKPAAAPAPPLDPTPTNSNEIPNLGLVKNQIKFYYGDPTSTGVASPTSSYAREVQRDETRCALGSPHTSRGRRSRPWCSTSTTPRC
jgi:hypothetical protein